MNLYAYVGNDPVNMVNPTGKYGWNPHNSKQQKWLRNNPTGQKADSFAREVAANVVLSGLGGVLGGKFLTHAAKSLSNMTKGKIGEAVARVGIALRGESVIAAQTTAGSVPQLGNLVGRAANAKPDFVVTSASNSIKVVEAKFGTSRLTCAQRELKK